MNADLKSKLESLRNDFRNVKGYCFSHFFCPILYKDEDVQLCKGHIVNKRFPNSSRTWTVQRGDVDSFYGRYFEADFMAILYKEHGFSDELLTDKTLSKRYLPTILVENEPVEYFRIKGPIPENFTPIGFETNGKTVLFGFKIHPDDFDGLIDKHWKFEISKDLKLPALISLIKSAHLTMFELVGYDYALSDGGIVIGQHILGEFFVQNLGKTKSEILTNAISFFPKYENLVRPIISDNFSLKGTITDRYLYLCQGDSQFPRSFIVLVKTSNQFHAILIPIIDATNSYEKFLGFLQTDKDFEVEAQICQFNFDHWDIGKNTFRMVWPKGNFFENNEFKSIS